MSSQRVVRDGKLKLSVRSRAADGEGLRAQKTAEDEASGARRSSSGAPASRTVTLKLSKAGRKALRERNKATVSATASPPTRGADGAGDPGRTLR